MYAILLYPRDYKDTVYIYMYMYIHPVQSNANRPTIRIANDLHHLKFLKPMYDKQLNYRSDHT